MLKRFKNELFTSIAMKNLYILRISSVYIDMAHPVTSQKQQPNMIVSAVRHMLCIFWDTRRMSWCEAFKPSDPVDGPRYQPQLADLKTAVKQKCTEYQRWQHKVICLDDNALMPIYSTLDLVDHWPIWHIHQIWRHPKTTCLLRRDSHFLSSTLIRMKSLKNSSMISSRPKTVIYFGAVSQIVWEEEKMCIWERKCIENLNCNYFFQINFKITSFICIELCSRYNCWL